MGEGGGPRSRQEMFVMWGMNRSLLWRLKSVDGFYFLKE